MVFLAWGLGGGMVVDSVGRLDLRVRVESFLTIDRWEDGRGSEEGEGSE